MNTLPATTGTAFFLQKGQRLTVTTISPCQVADLTCFNRSDRHETFSPGCTIDFCESIRISVGQHLYSNRGRPMLEIIADSGTTHDLLLAPCSQEMFSRFNNSPKHPSCRSNLDTALSQFGISGDAVAGTFNIFMNVVPGNNGVVKILPPQNVAGDRIEFCARMDLIVGLTACSDEQTNDGSLKPIGFEIGPFGHPQN